LIFRKAQIFTDFDNAHNLDARSILHLVISADCIGYRTKDLAGKLPIDYRDERRILLVIDAFLCLPHANTLSATVRAYFGRHLRRSQRSPPHRYRSPVFSGRSIRRPTAVEIP
jgi:hypothetical protein